MVVFIMEPREWYYDELPLAVLDTRCLSARQTPRYTTPGVTEAMVARHFRRSPGLMPTKRP
jgi:hypothetical protein